MRVLTPHKDWVELDLQHNGMFAVHDTLTTDITSRLRSLEQEGMEYLLTQWLLTRKNSGLEVVEAERTD